MLRLGFVNGSQSQTGLGSAYLAQQVAERCGGRIRVELYPGGILGGELETTQDVASGALEMAFASSGGYANPKAVPSLALFDAPFLFRDVRHARAVLDSPIGARALVTLEPKGIVALAWGENGLRHITTSKVAVRGPADLKGLKIRVPQSDVMVAGFKALGADAQALPFPDLYGALASGQFQAQENPVSNIKEADFDRVQRFLCLTSHVYSAAAVMISRRAFAALNETDQATLRTIAVEAAKVSRDAGDKNQATDIETLRTRGMTVISDIDRPAFVAAMAPANAQFDAQFGKTLLDSIRTLKA